MDLGAFSVMLWGFIEREKIYDVFELASGGRLTTSYTRVGGLAFDIPDDFIPRVKTFLAKLPPVLDEFETVLSRNRIFLDRTKGIGAITREQAIAWGVTGPLARAAGVDRDLRRDEPYAGYKQYQFEVPVHQNGDVYDRYLQRVAELRQSIRIVEQAIEKMPQGPINALNEKVVLPGKDDTYTKMESLIHHFMLEMPGFGQRGSKGEIYSATESPNGELGWFIIGDGSAIPYRVRCRPPSFYNYQAFQIMGKGALVSDVVSCLGSMNVIAGELDR
jgi:NADH:ubiquinone oxidoreductase subunit D